MTEAASQAAPRIPPATVRARRAPVAAPVRVVGALLTGVGVCAAFPDISVHWLLWIAFIPLLLAIDDLEQPRAGFFLGWLAGTVTNLGGFYWMSDMFSDFGHLPPWLAWGSTVVNAAWQGLVFGIFAYLFVRLRARGLGFRAISAPTLMVLAEAAVPYVFPWYLSNGLQPQPELFQIVEILGVPATSGVVLSVNAILAHSARTLISARRVPFGSLLLAGTIVGLVWCYGFIRLGNVDAAQARAAKIRVGMVEADVGIWEKESRGLSGAERRVALRANLLKHQVLSAEAVEDGAELIVWPESSYIPYRGTGIKRTHVFGLARTQDDRLLIGRADGRFEDVLETDAATVFEPVAGRIRAVVGGREDAAMVFARGGRIFRLDAEGWREELSGVALNLNAGWTGTRDAFQRDHLRARAGECAGADGACDLLAVAVGDGGTWLRRDAGRWERVPSPTREDLLAIAGLWTGDLYAVGADGVVVHDDGRALELLRNEGPTLRAVAVSRSGRVAAVGDDCTVVVRSLDGSLRPVEVNGCSERLRAVAFLRDGRIVAGGRGGTLIYESSPGRFVTRSLGEEAYVRGLGRDPWGRIAASLGNGRLLDVSDPAAPQLPELGDVKTAVYRLDHVGFLVDKAVPDDAFYLYSSPRSLPEGGSFEERARRDARSWDLDRDAVQRGFRRPLLFGAITYDAEEVLRQSEPVAKHLRNSVVLLGSDGSIAGMSHKIRLLVFGEYLPFEETFPKLRELVPEAGFFVPGPRVTRLRVPRDPLPVDEAAAPPTGDGEDTEAHEAPTCRLMPLICYEDILPEFGRELGRLRYELIINVTNDAWFGKTSEPALHLQLAAARSVETRKAMVRSTNTGISAFIDPAGRILDPTSLDDPEIRVRDIPLMQISSWHGWPERLAFWFAMFWAAIMIVGDFVRSAPRRSA